MAPTHALYDVDPYALTICKKGANRQRIFLKKEHVEPTVHLPGRESLIKDGGTDWSTFYCVVAAPGAEEDGGIGADGVVDTWRDETEIRKAAHAFARNKGYVNAMHGAMAESGCTVVENAIALSDFDVDGTTIQKGSWYIAVEPSPEFKARVDSGDITGVSLEGTGMREALGKGPTYTGADKCPSCNSKVAKDAATCPNCGAKSPVQKVSSRVYPSLERKPGKQNWVDYAGGLPDYIERIAKHLHYEQGMPIGRAIATAVSQVKKWAAGGEGVKPDTQAKAQKALAEWEEKKARGRLRKTNAHPVTWLLKAVGLAGDDVTEHEGEPLTEDEARALASVTVDNLDDSDRVLISQAYYEDAPPEDADPASSAETGSVTDNPPNTEEDDVDTAERVQKMEGTVADLKKASDGQSEAIGALTGLVEKLVAHHTKKQEEETPPTVAEVKKSMDDFVGNVADNIAKMSADIERLAAGASHQTDEAGRTPVQKSDDWRVGIL
jgi:hypothetical protein